MEDMGLKNQFDEIYKGKRVLLTGHTGFKGSWLAQWLTMLGANVVGFSDKLPSSPSHFELLKLEHSLSSVTGDVNDFVKLQHTFKEYQPEIVFHLAAQSLVRYSYQNPIETLQINIMGTANVLECCRLSDSVRAIVNVTSDKCYENKETGIPFKESDSFGGNDPYSASKGAVEIIANSYRNSFFNLDDFGVKHQVLLANVRAGNVIGGGDWAADRLIPDTMIAVKNGAIVKIRNPFARRPWQHVLEPLAGYLSIGCKLLEKNKAFAEGWNFGPLNNESLSVSEVLTIAQKEWNSVKFIFESNQVNQHEAKLLSLDSTKANQKLNWRPVWDTNQAIQKTISWYKQFYTTNKISTIQQIIEFTETAEKLSYNWAK